MEPFVFLGPHSFMEPQACEFARSTYYTPAHGENAWEYWFTQPGGYRLGAPTAGGRWVRSLQVSGHGPSRSHHALIPLLTTPIPRGAWPSHPLRPPFPRSIPRIIAP